MSESKCRVCGSKEVAHVFACGPVPVCRDHLTHRHVELWQKSLSGELTAGDLPVGATFKVTSWRKFGLTHSLQVREKGAPVFAGSESRPDERLPIESSAVVILVSLPKPEPTPEPTPAKPEFAAPPDSELPTYDEVMGVLGERWTVYCESFGAPIPTVVARSHQGTGRAYPGPWLLYRSDGLPYLNLQRDDGQRVRFEVPKDWAKSDTLRFLKNVAEDYRSTVPYSSYVRHVRWLPMAERARVVLGVDPGADEEFGGVSVPFALKDVKHIEEQFSHRVPPHPPNIPDPIWTWDGMPVPLTTNDTSGKLLPPPRIKAFHSAPDTLAPRPGETLRDAMDRKLFADHRHVDRRCPRCGSEDYRVHMDGCGSCGLTGKELLDAADQAKQIHEAINYPYQYSLTDAERQHLKEDIVTVGSGGTYSWKEAVVTIDGVEHKVSDLTIELTPSDMVRHAMERQLKKNSDTMDRDILRPTDAELFGVVFPRPKSVGRFPDVVPSDTAKRWRNVPADQVPRLERLLAEQVASGGTDCAASRSLLVRRERLIAEEQRESTRLALRRITSSANAVRARFGGKETSSGIAALNLEKPLIAYKRRGR